MENLFYVDNIICRKDTKKNAITCLGGVPYWYAAEGSDTTMLPIAAVFCLDNKKNVGGIVNF